MVEFRLLKNVLVPFFKFTTLAEPDSVESTRILTKSLAYTRAQYRYGALCAFQVEPSTFVGLVDGWSNPPSCLRMSGFLYFFSMVCVAHLPSKAEKMSTGCSDPPQGPSMLFILLLSTIW
jgi:hypothetical protein